MDVLISWLLGCVKHMLLVVILVVIHGGCCYFRDIASAIKDLLDAVNQVVTLMSTSRQVRHCHNILSLSQTFMSSVFIVIKLYNNNNNSDIYEAS